MSRISEHLRTLSEKTDDGSPNSHILLYVLLCCSPLALVLIIYVLSMLLHYFTRQDRPKYICSKIKEHFEFIKWANKTTKKFRPNFFLPGLYMKLALVLRKKELVDKDYFREIFVFQEDGGQIALDYYKPAWINLLNKKDIKSILKEEKEEKEKVNAPPHF